MPHFVLDCSKDILELQPEMETLKKVNEVAIASGLFDPKDIKVRMRPFDTYLVGGKADTPFIHVFADIMQGRTTEQKAALSKAMVSMLKAHFPTVPFIAMNVRDFEKATYANLNTIG